LRRRFALLERVDARALALFVLKPALTTLAACAARLRR
jgi:hypothetical protein